MRVDQSAIVPLLMNDSSPLHLQLRLRLGHFILCVGQCLLHAVFPVTLKNNKHYEEVGCELLII